MKELFANPYFTAVIGFMAHSAFFCVVFTVATGITYRDIIGEIKKPALLLKAILVICVITPLLTAGVVKLLNVPLIVGGVVLLGAVTPGSPLALLGTKGKKGSLTLASTVMALLIMLMSLTVTFWLWVYSMWFPMHLSISVTKLLATVAPLTIVPLLLGLTLNTLLPKAASIAHRISDIYSKVCILIIFLLFIVPALQALMKFSLVEFAAIIIVMSLALAAGYFLGGPVSKDRISIAMAATECNLTALLVIAHVSYPKVHILGPLLAYIIISFLTATAWNKFMLYRMKERGETLD